MAGVEATLDELDHLSTAGHASPSAMVAMGESHTALVARGLLPALTLPDAFVVAPPA